MNINNSYKALKGEKEYWKLFIAHNISRFGDSIDAIAFSWMAYEITGSASWLAIIMGINAIPTILFQPLAGALVERINKKMLMVLTDFGRGLLVLLIAMLFLFGELSPWTLAICTFLMSTLEAFGLPASMAIYPKIISKEKYTVATSLNQSASQVSQIIGMALAGVIIGFWGTSGALVVDAITFFLSGLILCFLKTKNDVNTSNKSTINFSSYKKDFQEGLTYFKGHKLILIICAIGSFMNVVIFPIGSLQAAYINESLQLDAIALSVASISLTVGMTVCSYLYPFISNKVKRYKLFLFSWFIMMILFVGLFINGPHLPLWLVWGLLILLLFLVGCCCSLISLAVNVSFMEHVEENYLARIGSLFNSMVMLATPIGSFIFAGMAKVMHVNQIFLFTGLFGMILFIVMCLNKTIREL